MVLFMLKRTSLSLVHISSYLFHLLKLARPEFFIILPDRDAGQNDDEKNDGSNQRVDQTFLTICRDLCFKRLLLRRTFSLFENMPAQRAHVGGGANHLPTVGTRRAVHRV